VSVVSLAGRLNRAQQSLRFKIVATIVLAALAIGGFTSYAIYLHAPAVQEAREEAAQIQQDIDRARGVQAPAPEADVVAEGDPIRARFDADRLRNLVGSPSALASLSVAVALALGVACAIIWLGAALTYLALLLGALLIAFPLTLFEPTRSIGNLLLGAAALTASFAILMQLARRVFTFSGSIAAVARNILWEAARMKISLVFILVLIVLLAGLPGALDTDQPLRYRVQSFLSWGLGGTFWTLALMTLFFSAATVAFEQRDRVIWQTMSKPVRPIEYLLGKWTGVMVLNAVLLGVSASGLFLFTEYLRNQPAQGEIAPYVPDPGAELVRDRADESGERRILGSLDRFLLHTQVLTARVGVEPTAEDLNLEALARARDARMQEALSRDADLTTNPERLQTLEREITEQLLGEFDKGRRTVPVGALREFVFEGLGEARERNLPLTLRYIVQSGANNPNITYDITFIINEQPIVQEAPLDIALRLPLRPELIDEEGALRIVIGNGDIRTGGLNPYSITFPPDGLEILYKAAGYEMNYLRAILVLWVKLGFIAAVAIAASTFLSFPVACLLSLLVLFAAETASFLLESLVQYPIYTHEGELDLVAVVMNTVAYPIGWTFQAYDEMNPSARLVDGRLVPWASVFKAVLTMGLWTLAALAAGWAIFRKRELATYSGN